MTDLVDRLHTSADLWRDGTLFSREMANMEREAADEIERLRASRAILIDLVERADSLAHGAFKAMSKADHELNRYNASVLCNAIAKERNSGGALA